MKKVLSILAALAILISTTACSSKEPVTIESPEAADLRTTTYEDAALTMTVPEGWTVETYGNMAGYSIRAYDPTQPARQIFYYGKLEPFSKSSAARDYMNWYYQFTGGANDSIVTGNAPVLGTGVATEVFSKFGELTSFVNLIGPAYSNFKFPVMNDFQVVEQLSYSTPMAGSVKNEGGIRATFTAEDGTYAEGMFAASLADTGSYYMNGVDVLPYTIYCAIGASSGADDFLTMQSLLMECLNSLTFKDSYIQQTVASINAATQVIMDNMSQVSAAMDSYNDSWSNRQTTMDRIAEQRSDSILGYDRVYDANTGETYKAELGWYDTYNTNRESYKNSDIYIVEDDSMYDKAASGYIRLN